MSTNQNINQKTTENNRLYPLIFKPILKSVIWGGSDICRFKQIKPVQDGIGESWEISGVPHSVSVIANGPLAGESLDELLVRTKEQLVGKRNYDRFGDTFPLLIKFIDARDDLSIQVHPDDRLAKERHDSFGKTEMWYVIHAAPGAFLYSGFDQQITPDEYIQTIQDNTFTDKLKKHDVKKGDVFFLPAGRVHAIGAGCFIAEIQQTSDITYRIYDFDRRDAAGNPRELHTELAKEAIDFKLHSSYKTDYEHNKNHPVKLVSCPYFTTHLLEIDRQMERSYETLDSFVIYICMEGSCLLQDNKGNRVTLRQGETLLLPADTASVTIQPGEVTRLLETFIE
ncbi:MAG: type I phosphomannose isomerase catalytic subunit [Proteiniphilum sp.]|jgi:mannose-6-phosphate isomerase|nr:mannose-6-phosphate isomerase [Proteiniphilum sp.]